MEIYNYVRSLQPDILVNNRAGATGLDMEGLTKGIVMQLHETAGLQTQ